MRYFIERRRRRILERAPFPDAPWEAVVRGHRLLAGLPPEDADELRRLATIFAAEISWELRRGATETPATRMEIAALAALPVLRLGLDSYAHWKTIVLVPRPVAEERVAADESGIVTEWLQADAGTSWEGGPVVLSMRDVAASRYGSGYNVVIHEAAHRIDLADGALDGCPPLPESISRERWFQVCGAALEDFQARVMRGERTPIDPYGAEDDVEFFAVMSETFFERPEVARAEYPEVYALFAEAYRQDPLARRPLRRTRRSPRRTASRGSGWRRGSRRGR